MTKNLAETKDFQGVGRQISKMVTIENLSVKSIMYLDYLEDLV